MDFDPIDILSIRSIDGLPVFDRSEEFERTIRTKITLGLMAVKKDPDTMAIDVYTVPSFPKEFDWKTAFPPFFADSKPMFPVGDTLTLPGPSFPAPAMIPAGLTIGGFALSGIAGGFPPMVDVNVNVVPDEDESLKTWKEYLSERNDQGKGSI